MSDMEAVKAHKRMNRRAFWWGFFHPFVGHDAQVAYAAKLTNELWASLEPNPVEAEER